MHDSTAYQPVADFGFGPPPSQPYTPVGPRGLHGVRTGYEHAKWLVSDAAALPLVADTVHGIAVGPQAEWRAMRRNLRIAVDLAAVAGGIWFGWFLLNHGGRGGGVARV